MTGDDQNVPLTVETAFNIDQTFRSGWYVTAYEFGCASTGPLGDLDWWFIGELFLEKAEPDENAPVQTAVIPVVFEADHAIRLARSMLEMADAIGDPASHVTTADLVADEVARGLGMIE